jgi:hypothetical protein
MIDHKKDKKVTTLTLDVQYITVPKRLIEISQMITFLIDHYHIIGFMYSNKSIFIWSVDFTENNILCTIVINLWSCPHKFFLGNYYTIFYFFHIDKKL